MSNLFLIQNFVQKVYGALPPDINTGQLKQSDIQTKEMATLVLADKVNVILKYAMGVGGTVAFILIIAGAFQIILSAGSPDRVKAGKEMITSAIAGLLLIIFSVFILRLIGYDILQIPGFSK
ncbi:MAG: hypothetical protein WC523_07410 [Patescibacteria group bacterium]|jgi:hypothetical protein